METLAMTASAMINSISVKAELRRMITLWGLELPVTDIVLGTKKLCQGQLMRRQSWICLHDQGTRISAEFPSVGGSTVQIRTSPTLVLSILGLQ